MRGTLIIQYRRTEVPSLPEPAMSQYRFLTQLPLAWPINVEHTTQRVSDIGNPVPDAIYTAK